MLARAALSSHLPYTTLFRSKGEAPLKETLAAAMIAASGWDATVPLYDPCCGSGTIAIEAAQVACNIAPGLLRRFGFERLRDRKSTRLNSSHLVISYAVFCSK